MHSRNSHASSCVFTPTSSGISQLFGLPPGELSEIPGYEEPPVSDVEFGSIEQLWGDAGLSSFSSSEPDEEPSPPIDDGFDGISQLWGGKLEDEAEELLSTSATRRVVPPQEDGEEGFRRKDPGSSRLSEMLAEEVYDTEKSPSDSSALTFKDYEAQVQEILEAEREELLETEAIMNAPPGADNTAELEKVAELEKDDNTSLKTADDELAVLEMDADIHNTVDIADESEDMVDDPGDQVAVEDVADDVDFFGDPNGEAKNHTDEDNKPSQ